MEKIFNSSKRPAINGTAKVLLACVLSGLSLNSSGQQDTLKSSPNDLVNALHTAFGDNHSRAVHAKGIILEGDFVPEKTASAITKAKHLQGTPSKVIVRFSNFTGIPNIPDNNSAANPRGFAIKFIMPGGETTDIVCHSFDGFPTSNSDEFRQLLLAIGASGPNSGKPTPVDVFLESHPVAKRFLTTQKNPASYSAISYFGVNTFKFTNDKGRSSYIRYQFIPADDEKILTPEQFADAGPDYLMTEIKKRVVEKPIIFKMYAQIAQDSDHRNDPSIAWPSDRHKVLLGTVTIKKLATNSVEEDKSLSFIPNRLTPGIETEDPMLNFRSAAYPISVRHRQ